ncbi:hypothetical protein F3K02_12150 [Hydrogenophaga sp. D2P1]|uniref:Uncharacterized protein n=1 Tax=Hydrogenophaga aromaticivorans TaxID=2610898 RepID=A0A7Y8GW66_9BURK|nr:hypothetical protein [Hydrogenophaga aromaticivorans]
MGGKLRRIRVQADAEQGLVLALCRAEHVEKGHGPILIGSPHAPPLRGSLPPGARFALGRPSGETWPGTAPPLWA